MLLQEYPRPANDNGIGIHFGLDLRQSSVDAFAQRAAEMGVKWSLVAHADEPQLRRTAERLSEAGILPISRWVCHIDQNILDFLRFVRVLQDLGQPAYIQIFNEPSDAREWRDGVPKPRVFVGRWCDHAARIADAGGFPGLQVLSVDELRAVLAELKLRGAQNVIDRMWFCPHPYGANHPPAYPYDDLNEREHAGAPIRDEVSGVLAFRPFANVFREELRFVPPFIAGEGGWQYRNHDDTRYPVVDDALHARYHSELFDWFRTGTLSNGERLPDYLFAFCPWILYGSEADAWYSTTAGTRQQTIDAVTAMSQFTRQFSAPPPPPPGPPPKVLEHYALFGQNSRAQRTRLVLARHYLERFNVTFGFSLYEASRAEYVTIMGDYAAVNAEDEARLKRAGCQVERWWGDDYAVEIIAADRLARDTEFG